MQRTCMYCANKYTPSHPERQKFCSKSCGSKNSNGGRAKQIGRVFTAEHRGKLTLAKIGRKNPIIALQKLGSNNAWYLDGRSSSKSYRDWQKNQWHHRNRNAMGAHTFGDWENLKAQYNWTCPSCTRKEPEIKLSVDHIIPLSKGGSNNIENIQPLCKSCNCSKHIKTIRY